uniref:LysR family transcriptional regulator n=1 Tax=Janibacter limosus TaxID=53458 RepID=A0AC61U3L6_9MICO|nr:LysR family transcriptional regulator [Janibacter limosus]
MELSLRRLQMLRELHRRGTVTAAAQALHYSPSGVSQQLAQLEREVGVQLIEKTGRRVQLTALGLLLSEHAEEILASVERATTAIEQAQSGITARLSVGVWASVASGLIPRALSVLALDHPGIAVSTTELLPEETASAVRDGRVDASFVIDYSSRTTDWEPSLHRSVVAVERLHAAVPEGAIPDDTVSLNALAEFPGSSRGRGPTSVGRCAPSATPGGSSRGSPTPSRSSSPPPAMIAGGLGVSLVTDPGLTLLPPGVDVVPLEEPILRTLSVAHRATSTPRPSIDLFVEAVRTAAEEQGTGAGGTPPDAARP